MRGDGGGRRASDRGRGEDPPACPPAPHSAPLPGDFDPADSTPAAARARSIAQGGQFLSDEQLPAAVPCAPVATG